MGTCLGYDTCEVVDITKLQTVQISEILFFQ